MDVILYLGAGAGAALAVGGLARAAWAVNRRIVEMVDLLQELSPDHGRSLKDQVTGLTEDVGVIRAAMTDLCQRFDRHMDDRERPE
ncbi:hypothetical protein OV450_1338 [Actinobacteria bacterium OV450]|nr:hypothetical protein OV450_1338 [Actinobacteria bacterium OV450]